MKVWLSATLEKKRYKSYVKSTMARNLTDYNYYFNPKLSMLIQ